LSLISLIIVPWSASLLPLGGSTLPLAARPRRARPTPPRRACAPKPATARCCGGRHAPATAARAPKVAFAIRRCL